MRTLKKTLCLVLVLAMMVGLCAVAANAATINDYPDKDEIKSQEAVSVLSILGILQGDEGGFRPNDSLTRAEGAKIVTLLLNAKPAGTSSFTDMANAQWAQSYVAYCEALGIIAGYGDGTFRPNGTLTYAQFAKMCLTALGYDATREQLVGGSWEIGTAKLVNQLGLANNIPDFNWDDPITRNDAAQMGLNTLESAIVTYNGNGIAVAGGELATPRETVTNNSYHYVVGGGDGNAMQMVENYFPNLKVMYGEGNFGEPTAYWFWGDNRTDMVWTPAKIAATAMRGTVLKTYTTGISRVTYGTIAQDAGFILPTNVTVYENGVLKETVAISKASAQRLSNFAGGEASLLKSGNTYYLIIKYPYLATVTGVTSAADSATKSRYVTLKVFNKEGGITGVTYETEKFAKKDTVFVYLKGEYTDTHAYADESYAVVKDAVLADSVTGTLDSKGYYNGGLNSLTIDGFAYSLAANCFNRDPASPTEPANNKPITAYVINGYALGYKSGAVAAADYVFVLGSAEKNGALSGLTVEVGYLKQDGTTAIVDSKFADKAAADAAVKNHWAGMAKQGSKYYFTAADVDPTAAIYEVKAPLAQDGGKYILKSTQPTIAAGINTNDNTVFLIASGADGDVAVYTGIRNVPSFKTDVAGQATALVVGATGFAAAVYIDLTGANPTGAVTDPIFIVSGTKTSESTNENGDTLRGWSYVNVETDKLDTATSINLNIGATGLFIPTYDADGYVEAAPAGVAGTNKVVFNNVYQNAADMVYAGGVIKVSGDSYAVAADAVAYVYDGIKLSVVEPGDLAGRVGYLSAVQVSSTDTHIKYLYFIQTA